jgi:hypothetical protein
VWSAADEDPDAGLWADELNSELWRETLMRSAALVSAHRWQLGTFKAPTTIGPSACMHASGCRLCARAFLRESFYLKRPITMHSSIYFRVPYGLNVTKLYNPRFKKTKLFKDGLPSAKLSFRCQFTDFPGVNKYSKKLNICVFRLFWILVYFLILIFYFF